MVSRQGYFAFTSMSGKSYMTSTAHLSLISRLYIRAVPQPFSALCLACTAAVKAEREGYQVQSALDQVFGWEFFCSDPFRARNSTVCRTCGKKTLLANKITAIAGCDWYSSSVICGTIAAISRIMKPAKVRMCATRIPTR